MRRLHVLMVTVGLVPAVLVGVAVLGSGDATPPDPRGPVAAALDLPSGPDVDARRAVAVAASATRCLAARGIRMTVPVETRPAIPDAGLDPVAWAERWGFGVSTRPGEIAAVRATGVGGPLDTATRAALYGDAQRPGCQELARIEIYGLRDRLLAPIRLDLEALGATIDADPGSRAADVAWIGCVAALVEPFGGVPSPAFAGDLDPLRTWFANQPRSTTVQALERQVAAGIARCDLSRVDARRRAAWLHETAFVAAHRDRLAAVAEQIRAAEAGYPSPTP